MFGQRSHFSAYQLWPDFWQASIELIDYSRTWPNYFFACSLPLASSFTISTMFDFMDIKITYLPLIFIVRTIFLPWQCSILGINILFSIWAFAQYFYVKLFTFFLSTGSIAHRMTWFNLGVVVPYSRLSESYANTVLYALKKKKVLVLPERYILDQWTLSVRPGTPVQRLNRRMQRQIDQLIWNYGIWGRK